MGKPYMLREILTLILLTSPVLGQERTDGTRVIEVKPPDVCPFAYQPGAEFCPQPSELYLDNDNVWKTKSGWKANEPSFTPVIKIFVGVQWKGVNIGRATCIYKGSSTSEFPVSLYKNIIINNPSDVTDNTQGAPTGENQTKLYAIDKSDSGIYNCFSPSSNICDCPFYIYKKKQETPTEIIFSIKKINGDGLPFMS